MSWDAEPGPLGRLVEHDERSRAFAAPAPLDAIEAAAARPVLWPRHARPFDQGDVGACTGFATVGLLATEPNHRAGEVWRAKHAFWVYGRATRLDPFPGVWTPNDTGSSGLAACKAAKGFGWLASYRHVFGIEHAKAAIQAGPLMCGTNWYSSFNKPRTTGDGGVRIYSSDRVEGGHQYEVVGYDPVEDRWRFCNSWSPLWGDSGYFSMSGNDFARLLAENGDAQQIAR